MHTKSPPPPNKSTSSAFKNSAVTLKTLFAKRCVDSRLLIAVSCFLLFTIVFVTFFFQPNVDLGSEAVRLPLPPPQEQFAKVSPKTKEQLPQQQQRQQQVDTIDALSVDYLFSWNWKCWAQWMNVSVADLPKTKSRFRDIPFFVSPELSLNKGIREIPGKAVFQEHTMQREGWFPYLITKLDQFSDDQLMELYRVWGMWLIDESDANGVNCKRMPSDWRLEEGFRPVQKVKFHIRVIGYNREKSISRVLHSLQAADYGADSVDLFVSIDGGEAGKLSLEVANKFNWTHGKKNVIQRKDSVGIVGQWIGAWDGIPQSPEDVLVVFEDDLEVSKHWYQFLKRAAQKYRTESFDARVYGIGLEVPTTVIGETQTYRCCGKRRPNVALKDSTDLMYKYQNPGTWGTALFPEHWQQFVKWYKAREADETYQPCVHNFRTNDWWTNKPESVFSAWFVRFIFEQGWYMLFSHMPNHQGFSSSHRDVGEHVNRTRDWGMSGNLVQKFDVGWIEEKLAQEDTHRLQVFDFHLNNVSAAPSSLKYRRLLFPEASREIRKHSLNVKNLNHKCFRSSQIPQPFLEDY